MSEETLTDTIHSDFHLNIQTVNNTFSNIHDFKTRVFDIKERKIGITYIDSITNKDIVNGRIVNEIYKLDYKDSIVDIPIANISATDNFKKIYSGIMDGKVAIFEGNSNIAFLLDTGLFETRSIKEPDSEKIVSGSHDGFVESLNKNINILRNRVRTPNLKNELLSVGSGDITTNVSILYLENIANPEVINIVKKRISLIKLDNNLTPGKLEEFIEDSSFSPFPQILETERPDRVVANLMDGRIAVLVEGSATASIMPVTFFSFYQSPDDYNSRFILGSFLRIIRLLGFFISISLPSIYIAIVSFHYEVLPYELVTNIKSSLEYVPYPPVIEALIMQLTLELLREAAIRLPTSMAQTVAIVGGLVIGTAIVEANLVSNTMIIVIAITAISSFTVPIHEMSSSIRLLSFPMIFAAALLGLVGIVVGFMFLMIHLVKLESFGAPYFAPLGPIRVSDLKDTLIRVPYWKMKTRPSTAKPINEKQSTGKKGWAGDGE
ncbi:spore germination protein [Neobacillus sp. NRS-1170]|uniref:spore germination protein n=1 Tax=Neobacillus sp. NRS-1170 TaxID=3233898 RepID=UPI003D28A51B